MTEKQRRELYYIERRLQQLDRWRHLIVAKQGRLEEGTRLRLARKIDHERAALRRRADFLRRGRAHRAGQAVAARPVVSPPADRSPAGSEAPRSAGRKAKRRGRGRRALSIAAVAAVLVIAAAAYFGSQRIDREAEAFLDSQLQEMIEDSGLQELINYSRVEVSSLRGRVRFFDVLLTSANPHSRLAVAELRVQMAPDDLVRLARDRETATLSGLRVSMFSGAAADEARGTELEFSEVSAGFTGHLPLETLDRPDTVRLSELEFLLEGMSFTDSASGFHGRIDDAGYTITGELSVADFQREPQEILQSLEAMEARIRRAGFELSGPRAQELEEFRLILGEYGWLAELQNWAIEDASMRMTFAPQTLDFESLRFSSPLLNLEGSMRVLLDDELEPTATRGELRINEVHEDIRAVSRLYLTLSGTGHSIPSEGPFTVSFDLDEYGDPRFDIR